MVWLDNKAKIDNHNREYSQVRQSNRENNREKYCIQGQQSYSVQTNKFSDQMQHEVSAWSKEREGIQISPLLC